VSFDAIAPWYRALETIAFGGALQRCRVACLGEIRAPHRALIVGEGNGRFLCELLRMHPELGVDCVDASERMLGLAQTRVAREMPEHIGQIRFLKCDITSWAPPENHYDLMVTHFILDCFPAAELAGVIKNLARSAKPNAAWVLADFRLPDRGFARLCARLWLAAMYRFFRLTAGIPASELIDPTPYLRAGGFALSQQHLFRCGMLKGELRRRIVEKGFFLPVIPSRADGEGPPSRSENHANPLSRSTKISWANNCPPHG
jgi:ubiquinone/menaquinone biosynthesis C-methylase UbiE